MEAQANAVGWPVGQEQGHIDPALMANYLDFLSEDLMAGSRDPLDPGTLAAVAAAQGQDRQRKRLKRDASNLECAAANEAGSNDEDLSDDEEEDHRKGRKGKNSAAAQNKANREKARREKINDRFTELAKLVDPNNEPKTDKLSILGEAIRYVQQAHVQISQAQTLQKFLEEKVGNLEKEKAQLQFHMFQLTGVPPGGMMAPIMLAPAAAMQPTVMQQAAMPGMMQSAAAGASCSRQVMQQQPMQQQVVSLQQQHMATAGSAVADMQPQQSADLQDLQQQQQQAFNQMQQMQQQQDAQQQQQPQQQMQVMLQQQQQPPMLQGKALMPMLPGPGMIPYWQSMMPASMLDSTQDSLLRPPAA